MYGCYGSVPALRDSRQSLGPGNCYAEVNSRLPPLAVAANNIDPITYEPCTVNR